MDASERVNALFAESTGLNQAALAVQAGPITDAARRIVESLLGGGKLLTCGSGCSAVDAQYFAALMAHRFERDRPGLPAITLNTDAATMGAIGNENGLQAIFAKQVAALGHPGDVLLCFCTAIGSPGIAAAIDTARDRQMVVIALSGQDTGSATVEAAVTDVTIRTPTARAARIMENHRLVIHALCDLVDLQLMGG